MISILVFLLGDTHALFPIYVVMGDTGHRGTRRNRVYVIVASKCLKALCNPIELYERIAVYIRASTQTRPRDYLTASTMEVKLFAAEVARSRRIRFRSNQLDLTYLLTSREISVVKTLNREYEKRHGRNSASDPDLCYYLADNAERRTWSAVSGAIPTLRRNCDTGMVWFPFYNRCLTHTELFHGLFSLTVFSNTFAAL